ncbi:DUF739 family protein [Facklamia hominis]|uniref:HTH cro/C1-type domain-containing protein n=1 Tax=Facklamia hominis CCUG 36813 TaxID=883111 RepID=K1LWQ2_9LACT|nr:DUF739 family protein [Facklamia hominis]EKB54508.1 hypothetical protein HMPREF9706_00698 [Facklamia hominis CCUG 36813]
MSLMDVEFDHSALKGRIREMYGTYDNLIPKLSYGETSLSQKLNGKVNFSRKDMLELAKALNIPDTEFSRYFFIVKVRKNERM